MLKLFIQTEAKAIQKKSLEQQAISIQDHLNTVGRINGEAATKDSEALADNRKQQELLEANFRTGSCAG